MVVEDPAVAAFSIESAADRRRPGDLVAAYDLQTCIGMRGTMAAAFFAIVACSMLPGCGDAYSEADSPAADTTAALASQACARATLRTTDAFERTKADDAGWSKGRVSDTLPVIKSPNARTAAKVLSAKVAATKDTDAKSTSYLEREIPNTGCIGAEFAVSYSESAPFPADAWTYFFWIDASEEMNISLFRMGNTVRLAAQRGGTELSRIDVDVPPGKWTTIKIEADLAAARPTMSITVGDAAPKQALLAEPLQPPYFMSIGTWSRGQVPAHEFWYDNVQISY